MRWPWSRKRDADPEESKQALEDAQRKLAEAKARDEQVDSVARDLFRYSKDNHFSELILESMRRKHS